MSVSYLIFTYQCTYFRYTEYYIDSHLADDGVEVMPRGVAGGRAPTIFERVGVPVLESDNSLQVFGILTLLEPARVPRAVLAVQVRVLPGCLQVPTPTRVAVNYKTGKRCTSTMLVKFSVDMPCFSLRSERLNARLRATHPKEERRVVRVGGHACCVAR